MGYYVMNSFTIRAGGVFSGSVDREDMRRRIQAIVFEMRETDDEFVPNLGNWRCDPHHCMSRPLESHKGEVVVLAGVFNYWTYDYAAEFAKRLSAEFCSEVMHACYDMEKEEGRMQVWIAGEPIHDINENWLGRVLRRVGG